MESSTSVYAKILNLVEGDCTSGHMLVHVHFVRQVISYLSLAYKSTSQSIANSVSMIECDLHTGKGVLSEHEHFPSGASGQSSLEYKCSYVCIYIRKSSLDYDSIKILIKISFIWPSHM